MGNRRSMLALLVSAGALLLVVTAAAATKAEISFGLFGRSPASERVITPLGPNRVTTTWAVDVGDVIIGTRPDLVCCNGDLDPTFVWNTKSERGTVSGSVGATDLEGDHAWQGSFGGRVTNTAGDGTIQMTDSVTGVTLKGKWTSEGVDPVNGEIFTIQIEATVSGLPD